MSYNKAARLYKTFTAFEHTRDDEIEIDFDPRDTFVEIGRCQSLVYRSRKWDGIITDYEHSFKKKPRLVTNSAGNILMLVDGSFSITDRGILK